MCPEFGEAFAQRRVCTDELLNHIFGQFAAGEPVQEVGSGFGGVPGEVAERRRVAVGFELVFATRPAVQQRASCRTPQSGSTASPDWQRSPMLDRSRPWPAGEVRNFVRDHERHLVRLPATEVDQALGDHDCLVREAIALNGIPESTRQASARLMPL